MPDADPSGLAIVAVAMSAIRPCQAQTVAIPELDPKRDAYKTEGANDPLLYDSPVGQKEVVMLYVDFSDAAMEIDARERAN